MQLIPRHNVTTDWGRMYIVNIHAPSTDPCGTPHLKVHDAESLYKLGIALIKILYEPHYDYTADPILQQRQSFDEGVVINSIKRT